MIWNVDYCWVSEAKPLHVNVQRLMQRRAPAFAFYGAQYVLWLPFRIRCVSANHLRHNRFERTTAPELASPLID